MKTPIFSQLKKKQKQQTRTYQHPRLSFLNKIVRTVGDVTAVVSHNIRFNWQRKLRGKKNKVEWDWLDERYMHNHSDATVGQCSFVPKRLEQNGQVYKQKERPYLNEDQFTDKSNEHKI